MIDLNVMLAAYGKTLYEKKTRAVNLVRNVKKDKHELFTPFTLMDIAGGWDIKYFRTKVHRFYANYSKEIITAKKLDEKLLALNKEVKVLLKKLAYIGVKEEDGLLVIVSSVFNLELKTFNRVHLLNKITAINKLLKEEGLNETVISEP